MYDEAFDETVVVYDADPNDFGKWGAILREVRQKVTKDDLLVCDMVDQAWVGAQQHYWGALSGGDSLGEVFLRAEMEDDFNTSGDHGKHWGNINRSYNDFMSLLMNVPCHVMCCSPSQEVMLDKRSGLAINRDQQEWVKFKFKPAGQKRLAHAFHTVLLAREVPSDRGSEWQLTTVKERGPIGREKRVELRGATVPATMGFVGAYLIKVAGWRL